jgi:antitoxin MazE
METRISKWGNSRAVRVPRDVLDRAGIDPDEPVTLSAEAGRIVIAPAKRKPALAELLAQITTEDDFAEVDYGTPVGREAM